MTKKKVDYFIAHLLFVVLVLIIIFIGMLSSAIIRFYWNNDCFEDFAETYCESINQTVSSVYGSAWSAMFECTIDERHRTSGIDYHFTEQEMEECLG